MTRFFSVSALAFCLGTASLANANPRDSLDVPFELLSGPTTSLDLLLDESESFDIISPGGLDYDASTGTVLFDINGLMFCFEFADNFVDPGVRLSVRDANGDTVLDAFRLNSPLQYRLITNQIAMVTPNTAACFYKGADGFGLEGHPPSPPPVDGDIIFDDRLEGSSDLLIEFIGVPEFVRINDFVSYSIRVSNQGTRDANKVSFQELYPRNPAFFPDGQLQSGGYVCTGSNGGQCADAAPGFGDISIRGENISLPVGGSVLFNISRPVFAESQIGGTIELLAGAIAGDMGDIPLSYDAKTFTMTVIGDGQTISAVMTNTAPPVANGIDQAIIQVTALDDNKNPTPGVFVQLANPDGLSISPASGTTGTNGAVTFFASTIGSGQAGSFSPEFNAPDLQSSGVSTIASVEFVAGDPSQVSAETTVDNAVANGTAQGIVEIQILDALDNPVENAQVSVQSADSLTFAASTVMTNASGIAAFAASSVNSGSFEPVFSASGVAGTVSSPLTFVAGLPAQVEFQTQPSNVAAGVAINPPVVIRVLDANDNLVNTDNSSVVTLQLLLGGQGQTFFPDLTVTNGVATFNDLVIQNPAQDYRLRVFSDYPVITSDPFDVFLP